MSATTATSMHGKGAQLPHDGPLLHPLSVNPHLEQLALDSFEENMIPNAIGFLRRLMLNSVPPTVTMIQFIIAVALCSPKAAVKRTEEKARRLRTEKYRLELSAKPTPEDIVAALDLLHRIGDMYPGELITALPPYSPGGTGDDGQVPPNPASAYASFAIPRPTSRLDPEASFSSSELPIRMYVWDYLMTCRDIWSLADIKEEYWEINPTAAAERRKHKRKLRQQIPQSDPSSSKSRDLSGFWNVLSVVAPVWKAQHEFIRRNLRERGLAWRPPPAEVSKLSLVHQCFHSVLPRTRGWSAATDLKTMLDTLASGLKSSEFQRPIAGKALPSRKSVALSILQEVFFLCEIDLIDSSAILRWLGPQCGVEVVLDDDDNPIALGPDEGKVEPSTLTLENVKEIENLLRGMTSAWFPMLKGYQIFERSLSVGAQNLVRNASQLAPNHSQSVGVTLSSQSQIVNLSDALLKHEYRSLPGLHEFLTKHKSAALQRKIAQLHAFGSFGVNEPTDTDPNTVPAWQAFIPAKERISARERDNAARGGNIAAARRKRSRAASVQPAAGTASDDHVDADKLRARTFLTAYRALQLRAALRVYAIRAMMVRRSPNSQALRQSGAALIADAKYLLLRVQPAAAELVQVYELESQQAASLNDSKLMVLWNQSLVAFQSARDALEVEIQALMWCMDFP